VFRLKVSGWSAPELNSGVRCRWQCGLALHAPVPPACRRQPVLVDRASALTGRRRVSSSTVMTRALPYGHVSLSKSVGAQDRAEIDREIILVAPTALSSWSTR